MVGIIRELRRRRVFRILGLYVGVCWILVQAASILLPTFDAPEWVLRAVIVAVIVGFPVVAFVAWASGSDEQHEAGNSDQAVAAAPTLSPRSMDFVVIGILAAALSFSVFLNFSANDNAPEAIDAVTVLIADFENETGEPIFEGVLEQLLTMGLEVAPYVALYDRRDAEALAREVDASTEGLPLLAARLVAVREAISVLVHGSIAPANGGYRIAIEGLEPVSGAINFEISGGASDRDAVLEVVASLSRAARERMGGRELRQADRPFAARNLSDGYRVTSLEAAKLYSDALRLDRDGEGAAAAELYRQAAAIEPEWGNAYAGWAIAEFGLGRVEQAQSLMDKALSLAGTMSEADRLFYLATYFLIIREDYENSLATLTEYVEKFPASPAAHNNLAVAAFYTLDFERAMREGRRLIKLFPNVLLYRANYALYAMYAGDFETAATEARNLIDDAPEYGSAYLPLAIAPLDRLDPDSALEIYRRLADASKGFHGDSGTLSIIGLADTYIYQGRFDSAQQVVLDSIDRDAGEDTSAIKHIALAESYAASGNYPMAVEAANQALESSDQTAIKVAGALVLLAAGELESAASIGGELGKRLPSHSRAYGRMLQGAVLRERRQYAEAIEVLQSGLELANLWRIHWELGRTYFGTGNFAEALAEFQLCYERRGEATAMFLDDVPTYRYLAELPYWTARAQDGLGMRDAAAGNYRRFLELRPAGGALVDDARSRLP